MAFHEDVKCVSLKLILIGPGIVGEPDGVGEVEGGLEETRLKVLKGCVTTLHARDGGNMLVADGAVGVPLTPDGPM